MSVPPAATTSPALARTALAGASAVFGAVALGAFTTSIGAGMAFPDWPLSNGSLAPAGWLGNLAMFAEHSHRLSAGLMGLVTLVLFFWIRRAEPRPWLRRLAGAAVALVLLQALVGGLRVLLDRRLSGLGDASVGRLFAMLHAVLAQVFVCTLFALAAGLSPAWRAARPAPASVAVRRLGLAACALLLLQLGIAAVMRHSFAGLALPSFPWSTPDGALLPADWTFKVGIHFAHRALALVLALALPAFAVATARDATTGRALRRLALAGVLLLALQIGLGIDTILTFRNPWVTTAHVFVGALTLAVTFLSTLLAHRDRLEGVAPEPVEILPPLPAAPGVRG